MRVWDADTYELLYSFKGHTRQPFSISWSPDSTKIASAGLDKRVIIWDVVKATRLKSWKAKSDIQTIDWSPDGKKLAGATRTVTGRAGLYSPTITVWDSSNGNILNTVENHVTTISDLAWNPDGKKIAVIDSDSVVEIWEV